MKKILVMLVVMGVSLVGLYANGRGELTTVEGKLVIQDSLPAIESADGTWMLPPGPFYRFAWEYGVSDGDSLVVHGFTDRDARFIPENFSGRIMPVEVSVNGKDLDIDDSERFGRRGVGPGCFGREGGESYAQSFPRNGSSLRKGDTLRDEGGFRNRGRLH